MRSAFTLTKSGSLLEQLVHGLPQLVWSCTAAGECEFVNQQWVRYTGVAAEQQLGRGWLLHLEPQDAARLLAALHGDASLQLMCRIRDACGKYHRFDLRAEWAAGDARESGRWFGSCTLLDIESRADKIIDVRSAATDIQQPFAPAQLATLIDNSNDAIIAKTLDGTITAWNKAAEMIFGYTADEMIGQAGITLFPAERMAEEASILGFIKARQQVRHYETQRRHKSGRLLDVSMSISPIYNRAGEVVGVTKIARDISEQKAAERQLVRLNYELERQVAKRTRDLKRAHRELQRILDAMPSIVTYWDQQLTARFCNRTYETWFEKPRDVLLGKNMRELLGEQLFAAIAPYVYAALRGETQVFERSILMPDGLRTRQVLVHYVPDVEHDTMYGFHAVMSDITALKQTEAALKMANHELEAFSYAVAHDLRSPLRAMIGFGEALQEECTHALGEDGRDYVQEIIKASRRMGELIDGLLALSRSTQTALHRERIDMSALVESIRSEYERTASGRKVQWLIEPNLEAWADPRTIEIVLRNLIDNACKYAGRVLNPQVRFYSRMEENDRGFCITDNGAGFDMAHADQLFKPFQRLHRQDEFAGIGIGLATVKRIVQRHGGSIDAISTPGQGATFCFTLGRNQVTGVAYEPANIAG